MIPVISRKLNTKRSEGATGKRILVVSQHFWPENFRINDIVDGFTERGIHVDVLCGIPNYPKGDWFSGYNYFRPRREIHNGVNVFRCGEIRRKGNTTLRIFLNYCSFPFLSLFNLPRLVGKHYDAVFGYGTSPVLSLLPAIIYAKLSRTQLIGYILDLWPDNLYSVLSVKSRFWRSIALNVSMWHYRCCDRLIALSESQARQLQKMTERSGKSPEITIIPQHCEDFYSGYMSFPKQAEQFEGFFNILFAGNISPAQDLENLVGAMSIVRDHELGRNVHVIILGDGMSRDALSRYVEQRGLQDVFSFIGIIPKAEVPAWSGFADALYAGLSRSANLDFSIPAKISSYMAAGRPLLIATGGETERAATDSGAAFVSSPGDEKMLAQNILTMCSLSREQLDSMGKSGRNYYESHYKRSLILDKLERAILR